MEASDLTDHISRRFNQDIEDVRNNVLTMGGLVETQLTKAIVAIVSGDSELGLKVARDDYKVNKLEVQIDEECSRILAMRSPAAGDLRLIVAIIKTITDLERIGDEAEKIEERKSPSNSPLEKKLASIAERLSGDISGEQLKNLQVETDILETILTAAANYHHHDTNQHHDHETLVWNPAASIEPQDPASNR